MCEAVGGQGLQRGRALQVGCIQRAGAIMYRNRHLWVPKRCPEWLFGGQARHADGRVSHLRVPQRCPACLQRRSLKCCAVLQLAQARAGCYLSPASRRLMLTICLTDGQVDPCTLRSVLLACLSGGGLELAHRGHSSVKFTLLTDIDTMVCAEAHAPACSAAFPARASLAAQEPLVPTVHQQCWSPAQRQVPSLTPAPSTAQQLCSR